MLIANKIIIILYLISLFVSLILNEFISEDHDCFTNEWVVKVRNESELHSIINEGFLLKEKVNFFQF